MKNFKKSTVYQIYPKSFNDSNGDGLGDLKGVTEKLDYLKNLGVDYIWLTPFYISPQNDNGYDVADYVKIDPAYGTMEDFEELVKEARKRDIDIMLDMVFNHSSTNHEWFKKAMEGDKKYKDYYIFKDPVDGKEPTNWISKFGGSAWKYVEKFNQYYLHLFDQTQADLNWENEEVKREVFNIVNYWIEKGVKGFRLDVINLISKPDKYENDHIGDGRRFYTDGPKIHEFLKELNSETFGKYEDIITVGEMSSTSIDNCIRYSNPKEKELSMTFSFHHLKVDYKNGDKWTVMDFDFIKLKEILSQWQVEMNRGGGWNALFWCNHDQPRVLSRFGDDGVYKSESAKMLATTIHMMQGTPYIYQGEEIGMTNPKFESIDEYKDVEALNYFNILKEQGVQEKEIMDIIKMKSRDNSRTPMQWNDGENAGFSESKPWINTSSNYREVNAENALKDKESVFYHYKKLIEIRKNNDVIVDGDYELLLPEHKDIFAYTRTLGNKTILVVNNFYGKESTFNLPKTVDIEGASVDILLSNYEDSSESIETIELRPYESVVYSIEI